MIIHLHRPSSTLTRICRSWLQFGLACGLYQKSSNKIRTTVQKANDVDQSKKEAGVTATEVFSQAHKVVLDANRRFAKALDHVTPQCLKG